MVYKKALTISKTVEKDLCINCGLCKYTCPKNAIELKENNYKEYTPVINRKKCIDCSLCYNVCPNTPEKMKNEALKCKKALSRTSFGSEGFHYLAWDNNNQKRLKSASGGAITKLASYLLENKHIDGVIHIERIFSSKGKPHYKACISKTLEEIDLEERKSSAYQPIDFSEILAQAEEGKTYLITATPCVIRGIKNLNTKAKFITCALICSHNTNTSFADYLADSLNIKEHDYYINFRNKDNIDNANMYNTHFYTKEMDIIKKNRFLTGWTSMWRKHYFAMNACLYCSDLWGREADISVKDAWGKWAKEDKLGKSIVIIRDKNLKNIFTNCGLEIEDLEPNLFEEHQKATSIYKQSEAYNKNFRPIFSKNNIKNGHLQNILIMKTSKFLYKNFGYKITSTIMNIIEFLIGVK